MNRLSSDDDMEMEEYFFFKGEKSSSIDRVYALVIYDIINNKKRTKFAKFMLGYGNRVQRSCFEVMVSHKVFDKMIKHIGTYCDAEDSIRVYRIQGKSHVYQWGRKVTDDEEDVMVL